jgi:hypothetical protein
LLAVCPEALTIMISANDAFIRMIPEKSRGSRIHDFDKLAESFEANLRATEVIQSFLLKEAGASRVRVGFHWTRDQATLDRRLVQIGIKKGIFADRHQFLRKNITKNLSAFRAVNDLICIYGVCDGEERFWDGLGQEANAQFFLHSEVIYEITQVVQDFVHLLAKTNR